MYVKEVFQQDTQNYLCTRKVGKVIPKVPFEKLRCGIEPSSKVRVAVPGVVYGRSGSLSSTCMRWFLFHLPDMKGSLHQFLVFFRGNGAIHSCRLGVSVGEGEFRIFLCCHLEPEPTVSSDAIQNYYLLTVETNC